MKNFIKNIFLMAVFLSVCLIANAQNGIIDYILKYDETYVYYDGQAVDTVGTGDSTWTYTVLKLNDHRQYAYIYADIDTVTGTSDSMMIYIQAKATPDESYTNLDTITFHGSQDTTFSYSNTTASRNRYWRFNISNTDDNFKGEVQILNFQFLNE